MTRVFSMFSNVFSVLSSHNDAMEDANEGNEGNFVSEVTFQAESIGGAGLDTLASFSPSKF